jgi:hypothetical protein
MAGLTANEVFRDLERIHASEGSVAQRRGRAEQRINEFLSRLAIQLQAEAADKIKVDLQKKLEDILSSRRVADDSTFRAALDRPTDKLADIEGQFLRLAARPTSTDTLAKRAGELAAGYWEQMDPLQQAHLQDWLDALRADLHRVVRPSSAKNERLRQAEVAKGAMEAIEGKAPPGRGSQGVDAASA